MDLRGMRYLWLVCFVLAAAPCDSAFAQAQHTRPIKIIVPFPAGDLVDVIARLLADDMAMELGQPLVV